METVTWNCGAVVDDVAVTNPISGATRAWKRGVGFAGGSCVGGVGTAEAVGGVGVGGGDVGTAGAVGEVGVGVGVVVVEGFDRIDVGQWQRAVSVLEGEQRNGVNQNPWRLNWLYC